MKEELWNAIVFLALFNIMNNLEKKDIFFVRINTDRWYIAFFFKEVFWYTCHWNKSVQIN